MGRHFGGGKRVSECVLVPGRFEEFGFHAVHLCFSDLNSIFIRQASWPSLAIAHNCAQARENDDRPRLSAACADATRGERIFGTEARRKACTRNHCDTRLPRQWTFISEGRTTAYLSHLRIG